MYLEDGRHAKSGGFHWTVAEPRDVIFVGQVLVSDVDSLKSNFNGEFSVSDQKLRDAICDPANSGSVVETDQSRALTSNGNRDSVVALPKAEIFPDTRLANEISKIESEKPGSKTITSSPSTPSTPTPPSGNNDTSTPSPKEPVNVEQQQSLEEKIVQEQKQLQVVTSSLFLRFLQAA
jgi:hypothetical protein